MKTRPYARTILALLALTLAAFAGLLWGPGKGVGTDDKVRQIMQPTFTPAHSPWRERLAPSSPEAERMRFALLGGTALSVLMLLLTARALTVSRPDPERDVDTSDRGVLAKENE